MPRLLTFTPCERVIISADEGGATLLNLVTGFKVGPGGQATTATEDNPASLPFRWAVFTMWLRLPEDDGKTYEQLVELRGPSGTVLVSQTMEFVVSKNTHRNTSNVFGFPIVGEGTYELGLSLRVASEGDQFQRIADFPIEISMVDGAIEPSPARPQAETTR